MTFFIALYILFCCYSLVFVFVNFKFHKRISRFESLFDSIKSTNELISYSDFFLNEFENFKQKEKFKYYFISTYNISRVEILFIRLDYEIKLSKLRLSTTESVS